MVERPVEKRTYVAETTCTQDLARTSFIATGARHGESITVTACGARGLSGTIDVSAERLDAGRLSWGRLFGRPGDNRRCLVSAGEISEAGRDSSAQRAPDKGARKGRGAAAGPAQAPGAQASFREIDWPAEVCPNTMSTVMVLGKLHKGSEIKVHVWSKVPNDVTGAMLRITHNTRKPNVSDEEWQKHLAKREDEWQKAANKRAEREARTPGKKRPERRWKTRTVKVEPQPTAPPPATKVEIRPPQPSVHAEWVPGYWHWAGGSWLWLAGRWRVPEADISAGLTVQAPYDPPPPRDESRSPQPFAGAVWVGGFWQWNGAAFVWIPGSWRVAPGVGVRWQVPYWRPRARGVVFVPGRWVRRR